MAASPGLRRWPPLMHPGGIASGALFGWALKVSYAAAGSLVAVAAINENTLYILIGVIIYGASKLIEIFVNAWKAVNAEKSKSAVGQLEECQRARKVEAADYEQQIERLTEAKERHFKDFIDANAKNDRLHLEIERLTKENQRLGDYAISAQAQNRQLAGIQAKVVDTQAKIIKQMEQRADQPVQVIPADDAKPFPVREVDGGHQDHGDERG